MVGLYKCFLALWDSHTDIENVNKKYINNKYCNVMYGNFFYKYIVLLQASMW